MSIAAMVQQLQNAEATVLQREKVLELAQNPLFKELILEGFCGSECVRLIGLSVDFTLNAEEQARSLGMAQAAGYLRNFLRILEIQGNAAENEIPGIREAIEELRAEEV